MKKRLWITGSALIVLVTLTGAVTMMRNRPAPEKTPTVTFVEREAPVSVDLSTALAATRRDPKNAEAWATLGNVQLAARQFPEAAAAYEQALKIDPRRSLTWSALGEARMQTDTSDSPRMPKAAAAAFDRTLALDPKNLRARFYKTMELDFTGQHDRAVGEWLAMLREVPMGSEADESIRAALTASVKRNISLISRAMNEAAASQPRYKIDPKT